MCTIIDRASLAERWGMTTQTVIEYEQQGIIHRLKKFKSPRYSMNEILQIEESGNQAMSVRELQLQKELDRTREELEKYRAKHKELLNILI